MLTRILPVLLLSLFVLIPLGCASIPDAPSVPDEVVATFSIVGYDPDTKEIGIAVQSKFFGVGSVVPWAKAGVGAVATQSFANVTYGSRGLELMAEGKTAEETVKILTEGDEQRLLRQVGIVDAKGNAFAYTGGRCYDWAGHVVGENYCAQGNILASEKVVKEMARAFEESRAKKKTFLADWLMAALKAGQDAGGDKRGRQSASLLVVRDKGGYNGDTDRFIDLRVEDHEKPIEELARLLDLHKRFYGGSWQWKKKLK